VVSIDSWWDGLTRDRSAAVLELVLDVIADDYECVDYIQDSIKILAEDPEIDLNPGLRKTQPSRAEIVSALRELTREGYAQAYILDCQEPYKQEVEFSESHVGDLWFYITPKGRKTMDHLYQRDQEND